MTDTQKYEMHPEIAKALPQTEEPQEDSNSENEQQIDNVQKEEQQPQQDSNFQAKKTPSDSFRELRAAKDKAERENELLRQQLIQQQQPANVEQDLDIRPEDLVEGKHLKKYASKIKNLEQKLEQYERQSYSNNAELRLKTNFPDFEKVVTEENIQLLNQEYPELAATLRSSSDLYNTGASAYRLIKKFVTPQDTYSQEKARVESNMAKPRSVKSIGTYQSDSPLTQVNAFSAGLTDELKKQLHKEMIDAMKAK